jgi:hypothetical protein
LVCLFFIFSFILGPAALPVLAQESEVKYQAVPVVILDFQNVSQRPDPLLGRKAADAMAVSLDPERYEVIERATVQAHLDDLHLTLPLDKDSQMRLGRSLNKAGITVYAIITGEVRKAAVVAGPHGVEGLVQMAVLMRDLSTGEHVNGALEEARSSPKPGYVGTEDALINEALTTVADKCVLTMATQQIREAPIMVVRRDAAILNAGIRDGMKSGMKMVVMRFREKVGYLVTTRVDEKHSEGTITENIAGIRERDKAIAIYQLPETPQARFGQAKETKKSRLFSASGLWGVIGAVALLALLGGGNKKSPGEGVTADVVATSMANTASVWQFPSAVNLVTWRGPSRGSEELLAYVIYRDGQPLWVVNPREGGGYYLLDPMSMPLAVTLPTERRQVSVVISIDIDNGSLTAWDRPVTIPAAGDPVPTPSFTLSDTEATLTAAFEVPIKPVDGRHHTYTIQRVARYSYLVPGTTPGGATTQYKIKVFSPLSAIGGPATAILPLVLVSPIDNAAALNPAAVEFKFNTAGGADEHVIQVCRDSLFRPENTATVTALQGLFPGGQAKSKIVDVASLFPGAGLQSLWWRAGARYTGDQAPPRVQPGWARPQDAGHVWSQPATFTITIAAPMPPMRQGLTRPLRVR